MDDVTSQRHPRQRRVAFFSSRLRRFVRRSAVVLSGLVATVALLFVISKVLGVDFALLVETVGVVIALFEMLRRAVTPSSRSRGQRRPR